MDPIRPELPEQLSDFAEDVRKIKRKYDSLEKDLGKYEKEEIEEAIRRLEQKSSYQLELLLKDVLRNSSPESTENTSAIEFYSMMSSIVSQRLSEARKIEEEKRNIKRELLEEKRNIQRKLLKMLAIALSFVGLGLVLLKPVSLVLTPKTRIIQGVGVDDKYNTYSFPQYEIPKGGGIVPDMFGRSLWQEMVLKEDGLEKKFHFGWFYTKERFIAPKDNVSSEDLEKLNRALNKVLEERNRVTVPEGSSPQKLKEPIGNGGKVAMAIPTPQQLVDIDMNKMSDAQKEGEGRAKILIALVGITTLAIVRKKRKL